MALNKSVLGALMSSKVHAVGVVDDGGETAYFNALAEAVIEHFTLAGVISTQVNTVTTTPILPTGAGIGTGVGRIA